MLTERFAQGEFDRRVLLLEISSFITSRDRFLVANSCHNSVIAYTGCANVNVFPMPKNQSYPTTTSPSIQIILLLQDSSSHQVIIMSAATVMRRVVATAPRAGKALSTSVRPVIASQAKIASQPSRQPRRDYHEKDKSSTSRLQETGAFNCYNNSFPRISATNHLPSYPTIIVERSANFEGTPRTLLITSKCRLHG